MGEASRTERNPLRGLIVSIGRAIVVVGLLSGCSSVPDAINPVEWYRGAASLVTGGSDHPELASPRTSQNQQIPDVFSNPTGERKTGLVSDRDNAKYANAVRREQTPTAPKPAARPQQGSETPADTQAEPARVMAAAPAAPQPAPAAAPKPAAVPVVAAAPVAAPMPAVAPMVAAEPAAAPKPAQPSVAPPPAPAPAPVVVAKKESAPEPAPAVTAAPKPAVPVTETARVETPAKPATAPSPATANPSLRSSVVQQAIARAELGPSAPPAEMPNMTPPPRPEIADLSAPAAKPRAKIVDETYRRRLSESEPPKGVWTAPNPEPVRPAPQTVTAADLPQVQLRPPSGGRGKGLAAPAPAPSASFQVASVDFRANSTQLTAEDRKAIADVAKLQRRTGGVIRVLGNGYAVQPSYAVDQVMGGVEVSMQRANAVARELTHLGVPASKVFVGAAVSGYGASPSGAQVFIDY